MPHRSTFAPPDDLDSLWRTLESTGPDTAVSVILKLRGETCDVDCLYCFEKRKEAPGGAVVTREQIRHLASLFPGRRLVVELHGGEPLTVGQDAMAAILDELAAQPAVLRVHLQTNGVQLDDSWLDLFERHCPQLTIGISLDGDEQGNSWRLGYDGQPVYPKIAAALDLLGRRGRTCGVITVVTPAVMGRAAEIIDHIASFTAVNAINLVPAFDSSTTRATAAASRRAPASRELQQQAITPAGPAWAVTPDQYARFVLQAAARWITAGHYRRVKLDPVVAVIRQLQGVGGDHCHFSNLKCSHVFTAYPNGRLGSCDELPWPTAKLLPLAGARSEQDVTAAQDSSTLLTGARGMMAKCLTCPYRVACGGGCAATRWRMLKDTGSDDAYCEHRARLIDGVAALIAAPGHPDGAFCEKAHWRRHAVNEMADADAFLARWDDPDAHRAPARLVTSEHGNINTVGLPGIHEADDLDPLHPQWTAGIEPRVRPLVDTATGTWQAVTYDSCEGHPHTGTDAAPSPFRVGLLPRDAAEYGRLAARACHTVTRASPFLPAGLALQLIHTDLASTATGRTHRTIEIRLVPADGSDWDTYFAGLDQGARVLTHAARHAPATDRCPCERDTP
ncbi:radical SAM protein [Kitasatospora sp. NPDC047058]|uniref:radical SAM/SPASM domain-containing protein n=1 Tax=Kitasatospora sp. NPDC047058 TaxID=3155620 RepID=UPI0033EC4330